MRDSDLAWVFGAAAAAAADQEGASAAAAAALRLAGGATREACMVAAVRAAVSDCPGAPFASLASDERAPLALARILRMDVDQIAEALGCDRDDVKVRLRAGLERLAHAVVRA